MGPELVLLLIVLIVVLFWRGPSTLPKLGEALGKAIKGVRDNLPSDAKEGDADRSDDDGAGTAPRGDA